ncbi:hypothetical protein BDM02DRAFT_3108683 [Thelephora ganbajun]|uniref:Uncharacterized protein n=1 Tax=Thelephora ganbajun TaxID=370292 RepID=A0ACB6ZT76_THEGA|nr:hypothetical protein BDM02DRAFT_3108683 [Thelephora ganbajun]
MDVEDIAEIDYARFSDASRSFSSQSKTLSVPMQELHPKVNEVEMEFLVKLDSELEKVDSFYLDREREVKEMYKESCHI